MYRGGWGGRGFYTRIGVFPRAQDCKPGGPLPTWDSLVERTPAYFEQVLKHCEMNPKVKLSSHEFSRKVCARFCAVGPTTATGCEAFLAFLAAIHHLAPALPVSDEMRLAASDSFRRFEGQSIERSGGGARLVTPRRGAWGIHGAKTSRPCKFKRERERERESRESERIVWRIYERRSCMIYFACTVTHAHPLLQYNKNLAAVY